MPLMSPAAFLAVPAPDDARMRDRAKLASARVTPSAQAQVTTILSVPPQAEKPWTSQHYVQNAMLQLLGLGLVYVCHCCARRSSAKAPP